MASISSEQDLASPRESRSAERALESPERELTTSDQDSELSESDWAQSEQGTSSAALDSGSVERDSTPRRSSRLAPSGTLEGDDLEPESTFTPSDEVDKDLKKEVQGILSTLNCIRDGSQVRSGWRRLIVLYAQKNIPINFPSYARSVLSDKELVLLLQYEFGDSELDKHYLRGPLSLMVQLATTLGLKDSRLLALWFGCDNIRSPSMKTIRTLARWMEEETSEDQPSRPQRFLETLYTESIQNWASRQDLRLDRPKQRARCIFARWPYQDLGANKGVRLSQKDLPFLREEDGNDQALPAPVDQETNNPAAPADLNTDISATPVDVAQGTDIPAAPVVNQLQPAALPGLQADITFESTVLEPEIGRARSNEPDSRGGDMNMSVLRASSAPPDTTLSLPEDFGIDGPIFDDTDNLFQLASGDIVEPMPMTASSGVNKRPSEEFDDSMVAKAITTAPMILSAGDTEDVAAMAATSNVDKNQSRESVQLASGDIVEAVPMTASSGVHKRLPSEGLVEPAPKRTTVAQTRQPSTIPDHQTQVHMGVFSLSGEDIQSLRANDGWLRGPVVELFLQMFAASTSRMVFIDGDAMRRPLEGSHPLADCLAALQIPRGEMQFLLGLNVQGNHWVAAVVCPGSDSISATLFDSLATQTSHAEVEDRIQNLRALIVPSGAPITISRGPSPMQRDSSSCGVHTIVAAAYRCALLPLPLDGEAQRWRTLFVALATDKQLYHVLPEDIITVHYDVPKPQEEPHSGFENPLEEAASIIQRGVERYKTCVDVYSARKADAQAMACWLRTQAMPVFDQLVHSALEEIQRLVSQGYDKRADADIAAWEESMAALDRLALCTDQAYVERHRAKVLDETTRLRKAKRYVSQRIKYADLLISSCKQLDLKGCIRALETTTTEYQKLVKAAQESVNRHQGNAQGGPARVMG